MLMIIVLGLVGLCLGSFVNALIWRTHEQENQQSKDLSIARGRSMCPKCKHTLAAKDLIPILSWLSLRGRCRYCSQPISAQYPLVEAVTSALFILSYTWWPVTWDATEAVIFGLWLLLLTGLMALLIYDLRWLMLPNRLIYPLAAIALLQASIVIISSEEPVKATLNTLLAVIVGGGLFYVIFQISDGKWIGGGDVKLGWLLGLIVGTPARALLFIFIASLLGSIVSLPLLATKRLNRASVVPFGPFLITAAIITVFFGGDILNWYQQAFLRL